MSFSGDLYPTAGATSVMSVKGDMVDFDTARQRLGIGSTNQVLQVTAGGLPAWQTLSAGVTVTKVSSQMDASFSTASTTDVDVTDFTADLPTIVGGQAYIIGNCDTRNSLALYLWYLNMEIDSTIMSSRVPYIDSGNFRLPTPVTFVHSTGGETVQMSIHTQAGTCYVYDEGGNAQGGGGTSLQIMAVG